MFPVPVFLRYDFNSETMSKTVDPDLAESTAFMIKCYLFHKRAITFLKIVMQLGDSSSDIWGAVISDANFFFSPYKIIAINCKQELNLMVAYGDFETMICFYCSFQCVCF